MELLDFWNGDANVLIWGRKFWVSKIIQCLKFWGPKSAICGLEFGVSEIIWTIKFLVCHCFFRNWTADDDLASLEKLVGFFRGLSKLLDISTPIPKVKQSPHRFAKIWNCMQESEVCLHLNVFL